MSRNRRGKKKNKSSAIGCRKGRVWIVFGTCLGVMSAIMVRGCHLYTYTHAHLTCVTHSRTLRKTHTYTHSHYAHIHTHTIIAFTHISNDKHIQTYTHTYTHTLQTHIQHTYIQALLHTHTLVHIHTSTHAHNTNTIPLSKFIFLALVIFT